ncbi:methanol dehydrogenase [Brevundimonas sp. LM2]|uniref:TPM domain-containing protein n=1 Tax=Brevundimonas sp. LM2 TaxID=1938605 RepID=UPI000983D73C|nr:TPM domain-containing protein [Brevundimonas sp. LM2]AQR63428.1 methanol dehydrogenase [Brevundimonas sp. LM2]
MLASTAFAAEPTFPALSGRVVDQAQLLTAEREAEITAKLAQLEADTGDQFVVVTLNNLQGYEIEDFGYRLGRAWGLGNAENDGGVLLIVAPTERKVRIEVGYGLEPILTDALSNQIIQNDILPPFRVSGFERGITAGVDAVITQLRLDPAEAQARAAAAAPTEADEPVFPVLIVVLIFLFLFLNLMRAGTRHGRRRRGADGLGSVILWGAAEALSQAASGRSGGFGGGGGGFSGGGGSFGGGGASGGW